MGAYHLLLYMSRRRKKGIIFWANYGLLGSGIIWDQGTIQDSSVPAKHCFMREKVSL